MEQNPIWINEYKGSYKLPIMLNYPSFRNPTLTQRSFIYHKNEEEFSVKYIYSTGTTNFTEKGDATGYSSWLDLSQEQDVVTYSNFFDLWSGHELGFKYVIENNIARMSIVSAVGGELSDDLGTVTNPTSSVQIVSSQIINKKKLVGAIIKYGGEDYMCMLYALKGSNDLVSCFVVGYSINDAAQFGAFIVENSFNTAFGFASQTGGYTGGTFDDTSDTISLPTIPSIGYVSSGGGAYKLSGNELNSLVNEIFVDYTPIDSGDTGLEKIGIMLENVALTLQQLLNSQFVQYVTDVHVVPVTPSVGTRTNIKLGSRTMNTSSTPITSDIVVIDCGTLNIGEYYANFIDYVGTVCKLYLPFIGFVDVKNEWFQGGFLNVTYHFNVIDGTFMAFLKATSSKSNLNSTVVASYGGSCCVHLPFVGSDYSNVLSGLVSTVNGASSIVGGGDIGGAVSSATQLLNTLGGTVNGSNNYNSNSAYLGIRTPYLYIERVVSDFPQTYEHEQGFPLNSSYKLEEMSGYTEVSEIHIDGLTCTEQEKNELLQLLQNGIIL